MKALVLTQGKIGCVDDADYESVSQFKWCAIKAPRTWYVARNISDGHGGQKFLSLHRHLLGAPDGVEVNHEDVNGLNNCRHNLVLCSHAQNLRSFKRKSKKASSQYRGVCWNKSSKKWNASLCFEYKLYHLGRFKSETDAARAYDSAAVKYYGEFSSLNFPRKKPMSELIKKDDGTMGQNDAWPGEGQATKESGTDSTEKTDSRPEGTRQPERIHIPIVR